MYSCRLYFLLLCFFHGAASSVLYVAANGTGTNCSVAQPCLFSSARDRATGGDSIELLPGVFFTSMGLLNQNITVYALRSGDVVLRCPPQFGLFEISSVAIVILSNLIVENCATASGAVKLLNGGQLHLFKMTFRFNSGAGAIRAIDGPGHTKVYITGCTFYRNTFNLTDAFTGGAALSFPLSSGSGTVVIDASTFALNECIAASNSNNFVTCDGGALYFHSPQVSLNITRSSFLGNYSPYTDKSSNTQQGGALYFSSRQNGVLLIRDSVFRNNWVYGAGGGAILIKSVQNTLDNVLFDSNYCYANGNNVSSGGAVLSGSNCSNTFTSVTFRNNSASYAGGAYSIGMLSSENVTGSINSCFFYINRASKYAGAVVYGYSGAYVNLVLRNASFCGNSANSEGR